MVMMAIYKVAIKILPSHNIIAIAAITAIAAIAAIVAINCNLFRIDGMGAIE